MDKGNVLISEALVNVDETNFNIYIEEIGFNNAKL